jgi:hypothetical protein
MALDLSVWDNSLSTLLGIDLFSAGIFLTTIFMVVFLTPTLYATRKSPLIPCLMVGFPVLGFAIAIGWLPYYFLLIIAMLISLMYANTFRKALSGD